MSETLDEYIAKLIREIEDLLAKADLKKRIVNQLCEDRGLPARFNDIGDIANVRLQASAAIRRDQFHARPLATAIREYMQMRGPSDRGGLGAATVNEIYAALMDGGFGFETKNDLNAKRGLRDALAKNTVTFRRVGDAYGLAEWYPKPPKLGKATKKVRPARKAEARRGRLSKKEVEERDQESTMALIAPKEQAA